MDDRRFGTRNVNRWARQGLITREQAEAILRSEGFDSVVNRVTPAATPAPDSSLNVITLFSYFGAFLALTGLGVFTALSWNDMSEGGRISLLVPACALLLGAGYYLRSRTEYRLGGNVLFLVGAGAIPVALFAVGSAFNSDPTDEFLSEDDLPGATLLFALSAAITLLLVVVTRIPEASLVPAGLFVATVATASAWAYDSGPDEIWIAIFGAGGIVVTASVGLLLVKMPDYSLWVGLMGQLALICGAAAVLLFLHFTVISGVAFVALYAAVLLASIPLQSRAFLVAGVIGIYVFLARVTGEHVEGPMVPLAFTAIGISLVILAIGYQRIRRESAMNLP